MELLRGEPLSSRLRARGRMSAREAARIARQLASALGAAHEEGITHRDLKPDNVFLVPDPDMVGGERVKVLDFGIAKLAGDTSGGLRTRTGSVIGTPIYMAPEQCRGAGNVDHLADIYALGIMLFEMLCGRPPFAAAGLGELFAQHCSRSRRSRARSSPRSRPRSNSSCSRCWPKTRASARRAPPR
jgi:serine/threonine-protein kinase